MPVLAEEEIDIWNKEKKQNSEIDKSENLSTNSTIDSKAFNKIEIENNKKIENEILTNSKDIKVFGIYDPAENNFNLNMWSQTNGQDVKSSIARISKLNLSETSKKIYRQFQRECRNVFRWRRVFAIVVIRIKVLKLC